MLFHPCIFICCLLMDISQIWTFNFHLVHHLIFLQEIMDCFIFKADSVEKKLISVGKLPLHIKKKAYLAKI